MADDEIDRLGDGLMTLRNAFADRIVVAVGAIEPSADCKRGNMLATVKLVGETETAEAIDLSVAIALAADKCRRAADARKKKDAAQ